MKFPSGYGSIIRLGGKRRKPYAVRITTGIRNAGTDDHPRAQQVYRYLGYFEKKGDAVKFLANYNSGLRVREHRSVDEWPTFKEVFQNVMEERRESRKGLGESLENAYNAAFRRLGDVHDMKICNVRYSDLQPIIDSNREMSKSSVYNMITVCHMVSTYAIKYEYISTDFSAQLTADYTEKEKIHRPYTVEEIRHLWQNSTLPAAQFALISIYTGMRPTEVLTLRVRDEDIARRWTKAGIKTDAGKDRVIPFHKDIVPVLLARRAETGSDRIFTENSLATFRRRHWNSEMALLGISHLPHDGRHTCATALEKAGVSPNRRKLILGHAVRDITDGVYTHVSPEDLLAEIDKLDFPRN